MAPSKIISELNPEQYAAATCVDGVNITVAGPGTGKTKTQAARAVFLVQSRVRPEDIVNLTFTNQAANEMQSRLYGEIGVDAYKMFCGTFHQFCLRKVLRPFKDCAFLEKLGLSEFRVLDSGDHRNLMKDSYEQLPDSLKVMLDTAGWGLSTFETIIERQQSFGRRPSGYLRDRKKGKLAVESMLVDGYQGQDNQVIADAKTYIAAQIAHLYEKQCSQLQAISFNNILVFAKQLLLTHPEITDRVARRCPYIQVDEYQDTNQVQHDIVCMLVESQRKKNLFVVGDGKQGIYGFRNADVTLMQSLKQRYNAQTFELKRNYRTTKNGIEVANKFAASMRGQLTDGQLQSHSKLSGERSAFHQFRSDKDEADFVLSKIESLKKQGLKSSDIAVLYRRKAVAEPLKKSLDNQMMKYHVIGEVDFYQRKEVKFALSLMRLMNNTNDNLALLKILDDVRVGITKTRLRAAAKDGGISCYEVLRGFAQSKKAKSEKAMALLNVISDLTRLSPVIIPEIVFLYNQKVRHADGLVNKARNTLSQNPELKAQYENMARLANADAMNSISQVMQSVWIKAQSDNKTLSEDEQRLLTQQCDRINNICMVVATQLKNGLLFKEALEEVFLLSERHNDDRHERIQLMTLHASKGLEFGHVIYMGCEDAISFKEEAPSAETVDEEGRLFYVGMTRSKDGTTYTAAKNRFIDGQQISSEPLRYLDVVADKITMHPLEKPQPTVISGVGNAEATLSEAQLSELNKFNIAL